MNRDITPYRQVVAVFLVYSFLFLPVPSVYSNPVTSCRPVQITTLAPYVTISSSQMQVAFENTMFSEGRNQAGIFRTPTRSRFGKIPSGVIIRLQNAPDFVDLSQANNVYIVGDFNRWDMTDTTYSLSKNPDGSWEGVFQLPETEYKFIIIDNSGTLHWHYDRTAPFIETLITAGTHKGDNVINNKITVNEGAYPINLEQFIASISHTLSAVRESRWTGADTPVKVLTNIKEMNTGMRTIYAPYLAGIQQAFGGTLTNIMSYEKTHERKHDMPGFLGLMKALFQSGQERGLSDEAVIEEIKNSIIVVVTDGGFKTRLGPLTLSYGYNGINLLPGGKHFRQINTEVALTILKQITNGFSDFLIWSASDNFTFFDNGNWNGRPLHEVPTEQATMIATGQRAVVLTPEAQQWLEQEVMHLTQDRNEGRIQKAWQLIMDDTTHALQQKVITLIQQKKFNGKSLQDLISERIRHERLESLGTFAVNPHEGTMSWMGEKVTSKFDVNLELVRAANENGGAVYKNVFLEIVNKEFAINLYNALKNLPRHDQEGNVVGTLDELPVSFMQTVLQSQFTGIRKWIETGIWPPRSAVVRQEDWQKIKHKGITDQDWIQIFLAVEHLFEEEVKAGRGKIFTIDMGADAVWHDAGDLEKMMELIRFVATTEAGRKIANLPDTRVNVIESQFGEIIPHLDKTAYMRRVVVKGKGHLIVHENAVLENVVLPEIPEGTSLTIPEGTIIMNADLSHLTEFHLKGTGAAVINYFEPSDPRLTIYGDELIVSANMISRRGRYRIRTPGVVIPLPYKGATLAELLINRSLWYGPFSAQNKSLQSVGLGVYQDWWELQETYPQLKKALQTGKMTLSTLLSNKKDNATGLTPIQSLGLLSSEEAKIKERLDTIHGKLQARWDALVEQHPVILKQHKDIDLTIMEPIKFEQDQLGQHDFDAAQKNTRYQTISSEMDDLRIKIDSLLQRDSKTGQYNRAAEWKDIKTFFDADSPYVVLQKISALPALLEQAI